MLCPGSPAFMHASCQMSASFGSDCAAVIKEITDRVDANKNGTWIDPHNSGSYSMLSSMDNILQISRLTGDKKYTDLISFQFKDDTKGGCDMTACSESQVSSVYDYGTNYCNSYDLFCYKESDCNPFNPAALVTTSFTVGKCASNPSGYETPDICFK